MNKTLRIGCLLFSSLFALTACSEKNESAPVTSSAPSAQVADAPAPAAQVADAPAAAAPTPAAPTPVAPTPAAPTPAAPTQVASASSGMDEAAIEPYLKKQGCMKCHAIDREKKGPSYKKVAAKYKGKPEGEAKIIKNITEGLKVKFEDGTEEEHKIIDTKDQAELKSISRWILSR